jgi:hypothetical protein
MGSALSHIASRDILTVERRSKFHFLSFSVRILLALISATDSSCESADQKERNIQNISVLRILSLFSKSYGTTI